MKISEIKSRPTAATFLKFIDGLPNDEVFSTTEFQTKFNFLLSSNLITKLVSTCKDYRESVVVNGKRNYVWGNKKTIATLRKQLNENI